MNQEDKANKVMMKVHEAVSDAIYNSLSKEVDYVCIVARGSDPLALISNMKKEDLVKLIEAMPEYIEFPTTEITTGLH